MSYSYATNNPRTNPHRPNPVGYGCRDRGIGKETGKIQTDKTGFNAGAANGENTIIVKTQYFASPQGLHKVSTKSPQNKQMEKYKNKYRIPSTRLQNWDYGWNGAYFITICTHNREHYFGEIVNKKMELSEIGIAAEKYWYEIPQHFPFVKLGAFVVMPNHIHGIIIIDKNDDNDITDTDTTVETQNFASLSSPPKNKFGPQSKNLASIIRGYKIGVTKFAKQINPQWKWQSRYYDHIIRNDKSYKNISEYIVNNPVNWRDDKFYI